jgi:hypothetical protein
MDDTDPCGHTVSGFPGVVCQFNRPKTMNHKIETDGKQGGNNYGDRNINADWEGEHQHRYTQKKLHFFFSGGMNSYGMFRST